MDVVLDEDFAKVWSDSRTPIVFSTIRQLPTTLAGLASLCDRHLQLVRKTKKKYHAAYSITDLSSCSPVPLNVAFNYSENFVPKQFRAGLLFKAFIRPRNLVTRSTLDTALKITNTSQIGLYNSFEEALKDINRKIAEGRLRKQDPVATAWDGFWRMLSL